MGSMDGSVQTLIKLVRIALGYETDLSLPSKINWREVVDISFAQGVAAIAVDGLQRVYESCPNLELELDWPELEVLKYEWFGSVFQAESDFAGYLSAAKSLAKLYADSGVKTLVLKGLVFSECYPIPSHRTSCDLDCYLAGDYEKGNLLVEQASVAVDRNYFKNSSFIYKGLHVENHHFFTPFRGSRKAKEYERLLHREISATGGRPIFDSCLMAPTVMFSALFCISHAQTHFLTENITLRHILDWALFRRHHYDEIDWTRFETVCREYGMWQFAQTFTRIGESLLGGGGYSCLTDVDLRLLNDTLFGPREEQYQGMRRRVQIVMKSLCSGWKYRYFSSQSVLGNVVQRVVGYFEKNVEI